MRNLRISALIVSTGLLLIGSAATRAETYSVPQALPYGANPNYIQIGDFNGDGADDIFNPWPNFFMSTAGDNRAYYFYGFFMPGITPPNALVEAREDPWGATNYTFAGDFNGDGTEEIVTFISGLALFMPQPLQNSSVVSFPVANDWGAGNYTFAGDFNGDGIDDIASAAGSSVYMKLGSPGTICTSPSQTGCDRFTSTTWSGATNQWGSGYYTFAGDFNGDGRADIASMSGSTAYMKLSTGSGFTSAAWPIQGTWGASGYTFAGDFNGDGLDDIATAINNRVYLKYSNGTGFTYGGSQVVGGTWGSFALTWVVRGVTGKDEIATASGNSIYFHRFDDTSSGGGGGGPGGPGGPGDQCNPICP
ncbi:MAG: VCBS repeat-containing protein [Gammaproteobacteria bacterium]|nr:VCBS repeat-containing protein [Gammaproteobacteria bacterium]